MRFFDLIEEGITPDSDPRLFRYSLNDLPDQWKRFKTFKIGDYNHYCYMRHKPGEEMGHVRLRFKERFVDVNDNDTITMNNGIKMTRKAASKSRGLDFRRLNWNNDFIPMLKNGLKKINNEYNSEKYAYMIHSSKTGVLISIKIADCTDNSDIKIVHVKTVLHYAWNNHEVRSNGLEYDTRKVVLENLIKQGYLFF